MSKWTDDEAIRAYDELRELGRYGLGRAILDLRERAEAAELDSEARRCTLMDKDAELIRLRARVAALEAALVVLSKLGNGDRVGNSEGNEIAVRALSGDRSALESMLQQVAGAVWAEAAPAREVDANLLSNVARRVMEGR